MDYADVRVQPTNDRLAALLNDLCIGSEIDWNPQHLRQSAWLELVPFAFWLVKTLRPRHIVELGTHTGVSYAAFCQAVERLGLVSRCHAVDTWTGDPHAGDYGEEVFADLAAVNEASWGGFSTLLRTTFAQARSQFADGEIDLLHIDGFHTYDAAAGDFETWRGALSDRGVVVFHDTNVRDGDFGVWRLWNEVSARYPHFELVHGHGLGIAAIGHDLPEVFQTLLRISDDAEALALVRGIFASRGRAVRERYLLQEARESIRDLQVRHADAERRHHAEAERLCGELDQARARHREQQRQDQLLEQHREQQRRADDRQAELEAECDRLLTQVQTNQAQTVALYQQQAALIDDRTRLAADTAALQAANAALASRTQDLLQSTSWRLMRPVRAAVRLARGQPVGRLSLRPAVEDPATPTLSPMSPAPISIPTVALVSGPTTPRALLVSQFINLNPLLTFPDPGAPPRLTMVTDSISTGTLFGGVGTAILFAAVLARKLGLPLRVVTRHNAPVPASVGTILRLHGIAYDDNIEFYHCGYTPDARGVPMGEHDLVLTTSWWTTWAAMRSVDPRRIIYLVQEDERLFYPAGDQQLLCAEVMRDTRLRFVVNTRMLLEHLVADGMAGIAANGVAFEPAFPLEIYHREPRAAGARRQVVFYARPNHPRNLFLRGIDVLSQAIDSDVFPLADWEFHLVGQDIPRLSLRSGLRVHYDENLPWADYAALIRSTDVGLSLMYTPHPSYPPLDLAASGAVVVTNRFGRKQSLDAFCSNILCVEPSAEALLDGLRQAVRLADDETSRSANLAAAGIGRDWASSFAPVLEHPMLEPLTHEHRVA